MFDHVYAFSSGALAKDWTEVIVPSEVIGEILLDMSGHQDTVEMKDSQREKRTIT